MIQSKNSIHSYPATSSDTVLIRFIKNSAIHIRHPNFEIRALDARDYIEYCMATQEYERLAVLIDEALDLYIDRVISLDEFKLIVSAAQ